MKTKIKEGCINFLYNVEQNLLKDGRFLGGIISLTLIVFFIIAGLPQTEAKQGLNSAFCNSDMCKARVERLKQCEGAEDIVACATNDTLDASYEVIYKQIESLHELATKPIPSKTWKDKTISIITEHEAFSEKTYCDRLVPFTRKDGTKGLMRSCPTKRERHSNGYGTISYYGAPNISYDEAVKKMRSELANNFFPYVENISCWNGNQKAAIADFMYNSGVWKRHDVTGKTFLHYVETCNYKEVLGFMDYWLYAGGLVDRKKDERILFLTKM